MDLTTARDNDLLRGLTTDQIEQVFPLLEPRTFQAGDVILRQGDSGDSLYIVDTGLVGVILTQPGGGSSTLAQLGPGQIFGEMAILMGKPRTAEIRALTSTTTYGLSVSKFFAIAGQFPTILLNIGRVLATRLSLTTRGEAKRQRRGFVVCVGALSPTIGSLVATNLAAAIALSVRSRTLLADIPSARAAPLVGREWAPSLAEIRAGEETLMHLSEIRIPSLDLHVVQLPTDEEAQVEWATARSTNDGPVFIARALSRLGRVAEFVVVNLVGQPGPLLEAILPLADRVFLLTPESGVRSLEVGRLVSACHAGLPPNASLGLLVFTSGGASGTATQAWARDTLGIAEVHSLPSQSDLLRESAQVGAPTVLYRPESGTSSGVMKLARDVAGLRVGLALGGGASKGIAHIGVIAALRRLGVPIDAISGTSVGSLVGAGAALGMQMTDIQEALDRMVDVWSSSLRPVLPGSSLLSAAGFNRVLEQLAGDVNIEELAIPFGAVAADLNTGRPVYILSGSIARAMRCSASLPVLFSPIIHGEYVLVDGGVTTPVPTHLARVLGADIVLASELSGTQVDSSPIDLTEPDPASASASPRVPNLLQTYLRTIDIMRGGRSEHDLMLADVVFSPQLPHLGWSDFQKGGVLVEAGEKAVEDRLEELQAVLPWLRSR
ncbi:MAG: patatin-like phospholipase family protein [Chloroflexota bacterium]